MTTNQLDLFSDPKFADELKPPPDQGIVTLRTRHREVQIPLKRKRREAIAKLMPILEELEGKDIWIGSYDAGGRHFWLDNLKLPKLKLDYHPIRFRNDGNWLPAVIVLWGSRTAQVRIFTDYLVNVRVQEYQGYWHYLLDFRCGLYENKLDTYHSHYSCLTITRFKD